MRLFFDVDGAKLVPDGPWMRERPTVVLLHPGPGFDHGLFKVQLGPWLAAGTQVVYLDLRGGGRSDRGHAGGAPARALGGRRAGALRRARHRAPGRARPRVRLDRRARLRGPPSRPSGRARPRRARRADRPGAVDRAYERLGGAEARAVAERFYGGMDEQGFADFVRVCFPLLSSYALTSDVIALADWNPAVLIEWMAARPRASTCATSSRRSGRRRSCWPGRTTRGRRSSRRRR